MQRSLSRMVKDNRQKLRQKIAEAHAKITNIRQDSLHKVTRYLTDNFGELEDLGFECFWHVIKP